MGRQRIPCCFGNSGVSLPAMQQSFLGASLAFATALSAFAEAPKLPGVGVTRQEAITKNEIAGAIPVVVTKRKKIGAVSFPGADHD